MIDLFSFEFLSFFVVIGFIGLILWTAYTIGRDE